jgi:hypothetical protein
MVCANAAPVLASVRIAATAVVSDENRNSKALGIVENLMGLAMVKHLSC